MSHYSAFLHNSWMQKSFEKFCFGAKKKETRMQIIVPKCKCKYSCLCESNETSAYTQHSQLIKHNDVFFKESSKPKLTCVHC